jgi:hypothetical protein
VYAISIKKSDANKLINNNIVTDALISLGLKKRNETKFLIYFISESKKSMIRALDFLNLNFISHDFFNY